MLDVKNSNLFYFDSDCLDSIKSEIYGYAFYKQEEFLNNGFDYQNIGNGSFILVQNLDNKICITQDFIGSYGLYFFKSEGFFAVSNSFLLLAEKITLKFPLTLNRDNINQFLLSSLVSVSYSETMINEIQILPRNARFIIDKLNKSYHLEYIDFKENSVDINSEYGISILDAWFQRWVTFIRGLIDNSKYVTVDLSGGFDSRLVFMLFLCSGVDLSKVKINSLDNNLHTHTEDYEIASKIAKHFNFKLNHEAFVCQSRELSLKESMDIALYTKLSVHKQMRFPSRVFSDSIYYFGGSGGETIRNYWGMNSGEYLRQYATKQINNNYYSSDYFYSFKKIFDKSMREIQDKYQYYQDDNFLISRLFYKETRCRYHFGRDMVANYFTNNIRCVPLLDLDLQKIRFDAEYPDLLMAVIFDRYCSKLLDFHFEGGRSIDANTISKAREINTRFVYSDKYSGAFKILKSKSKNCNQNLGSVIPFNEKSPLNFIKKLFFSKHIKGRFTSYFSDDFYDYSANYLSNNKYESLSEANTVVSVARLIDLCYGSNNGNVDTYRYYLDIFNSESNLISSNVDRNYTRILASLSIRELAVVLSKARVDIRNVNQDLLESNIDIQVVKSDGVYDLFAPKWFAKERVGIGYVLQSSGSKIELILRPKNDGELVISLRATDVRSKSSAERIQFNIDYHEFTVNDQDIFIKPISVSHDNAFHYKNFVKKDQSIRVVLQWTMHEYNKIEMIDLLSKLL